MARIWEKLSRILQKLKLKSRNIYHQILQTRITSKGNFSTQNTLNVQYLKNGWRYQFSEGILTY